MVMYTDQKARRNNNTQIDNKYLGKVERFKYLGKTIRKLEFHPGGN